MIVLRRKSAMKSMPTLLIQICICFSSFTLLYFVNHALTQMRWEVPYTYGSMHQLILYMIFLLVLFFFVFPNFLKQKSRYHVIYVTKKIPCKSRGVQRYFLGDHVLWCCMRTDQYYQSSFVAPPTILETTTAGKVNLDTITLMTSVVNADLTVVFAENSSQMVCHSPTGMATQCTIISS